MRLLVVALVALAPFGCRRGTVASDETDRGERGVAAGAAGRSPSGRGIAGPHYSFYIEGQARVLPGARARSYPAMVCAGHALSLKTRDGGSKAPPHYGHPAYDPAHDRTHDPTHAFTYYSPPSTERVFRIDEFMYSPAFLHDVSVYLWLEPSPALAARCAGAHETVIAVPLREVYPGYKGEGPTMEELLAKGPCSDPPDPTQSLASAVLFREDTGQSRETVSLDLR